MTRKYSEHLPAAILPRTGGLAASSCCNVSTCPWSVVTVALSVVTVALSVVTVALWYCLLVPIFVFRNHTF